MTDYVNQYDKSLSYTQLMARPGDIRGIMTKDGWIIFRVMTAELTFWEFYRWSTAFAADGTANSGQVDNRIQDSSSREILYHERKGELWEAFQGYNHPHIRVWQKYNGEKFGRLQKDIGDPLVQSTSASDFGFSFRGEDSLYGRETGYGRFFIPPYQYTTFDIANVSGTTLYLMSRYPINKMSVEPMDPADPDDLKLMIEILRGRIRKDVYLWSAGLEGYPWSHAGIKQITGVSPLQWNGKKATVNNKVVYPIGGE